MNNSDFEDAVRYSMQRRSTPRYAVWVLYSTAAGSLRTTKVYANSLQAGLEAFQMRHLQMADTALAYIIRRARDNDTLQGEHTWKAVPTIDSIHVEAVKAQPVQAKGIHVAVTKF